MAIRKNKYVEIPAGGLINKLKAIAKKFGKTNPEVVVVYTKDYAVYVHEDLKAYHRVGQAKFLEAPARTVQATLKSNLRRDLKRGLEMWQALYKAGLRLQRESQKLVPVDTGDLKGSADTRIRKK